MKKYVVIGGCSYAFRELGNLELLINTFTSKKIELQFIDLRANSAGNEFITESIIIAVNTLLNNGILPNDIIVINNFTQIFRPVVKLPYEYHNKVKHLFEFSNADVRIVENIKYASCESLIMVGNQIYSFLYSDKHLEDDVKDWYDIQSNNYRIKKIVEQYFESYLTNILTLQTYLKQKNIHNISYLMNNVFNGWLDNFSHVYNKHTSLSLPNTVGTKHISEISEITKAIWDCIDLNSFVFYKTDINEYGGIDEYMLDNFPNRKYMQNPELKDFIFGNHPNGFIYHQFAIDCMSEKLKNWVNEIYN